MKKKTVDLLLEYLMVMKDVGGKGSKKAMNPQLETMSLDEFLCEYRELLTERERERGNLILEAFSLVDYVESSIDVEQVYL